MGHMGYLSLKHSFSKLFHEHRICLLRACTHFSAPHTHTEKTILRAGTPFNPTVMDLSPTESQITRAINANGSANHNNSVMV